MSAIDEAFGKDEGLRKRIYAAISAAPQYRPLFEEIAAFHNLNSQRPSPNGAGGGTDEPASKKRKLLNGSLPIGTPHGQPREVILEARDISFSIPQRKKLHLCIVQYGQDLKGSNTSFAICARNPATNDLEFEIPLSAFAYALRLPLPEKVLKQYNFCLLPKADSQATGVEPLVWTINHGPLKSYQISSPQLAALAPGPDEILERALDAVLRRDDVRLVYPTADEFASPVSEPHRKGDKAYHVKAFRGSKDGYLFFLENGIFFAFKKPLLFLAFEDVESVSYTSVLQRTFNLNVSYKESPSSDPQEVEFSMLDQADFAGIDTYIKRHQLQDASMAEARRAKKVNAAAAKQAVVTNGEEIDERTELQKAEAEIEDEEDELEEDYDPSDDGDSDGSGTSEEEEEEYAHHVEKADLVKDELGSEAEDVDLDDDNQL